MKLQFEIPESLAAWLQAVAAERGQDVETCCVQLLENYIRLGDQRPELWLRKHADADLDDGESGV